MKTKRFELLLTEDQLNELEGKTRKVGFSSKSEYIRFILFHDTLVKEKIDRVYQKVVENER